jgi:chondroitin AC lyase
MLPLKLCAALVVALLIPPNQHPERHLPFHTPAVANASEDLEIIRARVIGDLLQSPITVEEIKVLLESIRPDGSWGDIDYTDVSRTGFQHSRHLQNLYDLARAYKKSDSPWYQNPRAKDAALSALDYWLQHDFICDNWWWNEMGTPGRMINILLVLDTDLTEAQVREGLRIAGRANLEASGARPGGDRIQIAAMLGKQALFRRDETVLNRVVSVMTDEITITTGRGLKPDMSFHHRVDNVICTLSYGLGYANAFSYWAVKVAGTKYQFPGHTSELLIDYFLDGICKSMVHGKYPDPGAKNRDLSRKGTLNPASPELAENLLKISDYRRAELEQIVRIRKGQADPNLTWNRFFWHSEYFTHQRPGYFASVRMHSTRNHTMEQPHNEEGLKMHHVADGANFISVTGAEYLDIFPVWDWQKIPGTTTVQKPQHPHWNEIAKKGLSDFVGGVSDGQFGAAAFDFKSAHDPLKARKAWFFFDDEYVCLGSGITSEAEYTVVTTLNQHLLNGAVIMKSRKDIATLDKGEHVDQEASWVYHDGVGYVFPQEERVNVSSARASGRWKDINHQTTASDEPVEMDVFSLWIDHGVKPQDARYEYIVVPATSPEALDQFARNLPLEIISNTASLQALRHNELNRAQIIFYQPGKIKVNDHVSITAESPCMIMVKTSGKSIEHITVADPSRKLDSLQLRTSVLIESSGENWRAIWDKKAKESVLTIDLPKEGYAGESVVVNLVNQ